MTKVKEVTLHKGLEQSWRLGMGVLPSAATERICFR